MAKEIEKPKRVEVFSYEGFESEEEARKWLREMEEEFKVYCDDDWHFSPFRVWGFPTFFPFPILVVKEPKKLEREE